MANGMDTFMRAVTSRNPDALVKVLDLQNLINRKIFKYDTTALIFSVKQDYLRMVRCLLKVDGIDINAVDTGERSSLHWAAEIGKNKEAVKLLLKMPDV